MKNKVIIIGLPKTGTSTLTVMLRVLNYRVTGPNIDYYYGDKKYLRKKIEQFDGFQDYPWCFEWKEFLDVETTKFILLKRNVDSWWESFYKSYGGLNENYLSYPYIRISKTNENKNAFVSYYEDYYTRAEKCLTTTGNKYLLLHIESLSWDELCSFLEEDIPKNILGKRIGVPHINKNNHHKRATLKFKIQNKIKKVFVKFLGQSRYLKIVTFLRKNELIS
jgi:hypothetical protein